MKSNKIRQKFNEALMEHLNDILFYEDKDVKMSFALDNNREIIKFLTVDSINDIYTGFEVMLNHTNHMNHNELLSTELIDSFYSLQLAKIKHNIIRFNLIKKNIIEKRKHTKVDYTVEKTIMSVKDAAISMEWKQK